MWASAIDGPCASDLASAKAASRNSASGTTRLTRPSVSQRRGVDPIGQEHQFPRPRCSDQPGQHPRDAVIPGQPDPGVSRRHDCGFAGNADIAGKRERHPRAGRGSRKCCNRRFPHRHQRTGQGALLGPQIGNAFFERRFGLA